jgi:hypothetical protein
MTGKRFTRSSNSILEVSGNIGDVSAERIVLGRVRAVPVSEGKRETFTRQHLEDALDKVSRSAKGKYADVPYSSEDLIRDKRAEVELEDRKP